MPIQEIIKITLAIAIAAVSYQGLKWLQASSEPLFWTVVVVLCIYTIKKMKLKVGLPKWKWDE